jgi:hypothetical protein
VLTVFKSLGQPVQSEISELLRIFGAPPLKKLGEAEPEKFVFSGRLVAIG